MIPLILTPSRSNFSFNMKVIGHVQYFSSLRDVSPWFLTQQYAYDLIAQVCLLNNHTAPTSIELH